MSWTNDHDVLLLREMIVSNPFQHKTGSRAIGSCWDLIAATLNSIDKPVFKVDQRSIRDHFNKLLKEYKRKRAN